MVCGSVRDSVGGAVIEVFGVDALGMVGMVGMDCPGSVLDGVD